MGSVKAIALLGIYPKDTNVVIRKGTCTPMFMAAMSTIAKLLKEPRCLSTDEWIKKIWYIYVYVCVCMCVCVYHIFFIHSSVNGHLGSFHSLAIVDIVATNIWVHVPLWSTTSVSLR